MAFEMRWTQAVEAHNGVTSALQACTSKYDIFVMSRNGSLKGRFFLLNGSVGRKGPFL